ncbi:hypothetical protein [Euryhalocaulis caribicus]|uniref:hypothetical protein n=1 Tax=Euryhalocaulis caribicus TaxID=1161401 RepID=UPI0003B4E7F1|nr:hypothetical protein [Euryhalocaulis caribicus]
MALPFLPDDHHYAITAVTTRASQLDQTVVAGIATFLFDRFSAAKIIAGRMRTLDQLALLQCLMEESPECSGADIAGLFARIRMARTDRNKIVHWLWGKSEHPDEAVSSSVTVFKDGERRTWTAQQIYEVAESCMQSTHELNALMTLKHDAAQRDEIVNALMEVAPKGAGLFDLD